MGISNISSSRVRKTKGKNSANLRGVVGQGSGGDNSYTVEEDGIFYRVHEFTSSGTFSVQAAAEYRVLVIAGGGANGRYGGGGAGGMQDRFLDLTAGDITVTVGAAGIGGNGGSSSFGSHISCSGGGLGGADQVNGSGGGSGGGGGSSNNNNGTGQGGGTGMGTIAPDQGTSGGRGYG